MSYARPQFDLHFDWVTWVLILLMGAFQGVSLLLVSWSQHAFSVPQQETDITITGGILLLVAVELTVLIGLWRLYKRLSEKWQRYVKYTLYGVLGGIGWTIVFALYWGSPLRFLRDVTVGVTVYFVVKFTQDRGLRWIAFNLIAFTAGVIITSIMGQQLAPSLVIVIMVAFLVYDKIAVDLTAIMGDLMQFSASTKLPNFFVIPTQLRVNLNRLFAFLRGETDEKPDTVASIIGLGDFLFPTLLVVSAFVATGLKFAAPVVGAILGTLVAFPILRGAIIRRDKATPALPWLNTGAICGYGIGLLTVGIGV